LSAIFNARDDCFVTACVCKFITFLNFACLAAVALSFHQTTVSSVSRSSLINLIVTLFLAQLS